MAERKVDLRYLETVAKDLLADGVEDPLLQDTLLSQLGLIAELRRHRAAMWVWSALVDAFWGHIGTIPDWKKSCLQAARAKLEELTP